MSIVPTATPAETEAVRDPAERLLATEVQALLRKQAEQDRLEQFYRSAMINCQVEQLKLAALIRRYLEARDLVMLGAAGAES